MNSDVTNLYFPGKCDDTQSVTDEKTYIDVNAQDAAGRSALHFAVMSGNKEIVIELLSCKPLIKG